MELGRYKGKFVGETTILGFEKDKTYIFELDKKPDSAYDIMIEDEDLYMKLSSEISIKRNFVNLEKLD